MTLPAQTPLNRYVYAGVNTFAYSFLILDAGDLAVSVNNVLQPAGNYSVSGVGNATGGTVTYIGPALTIGQIVAIQRSVHLERLADYQEVGDFLAGDVNADLDRLWMALQDQAAVINTRTVRAPLGDILNELPIATSRANTIPGFDANGQLVLAGPASGTATALALQLASGPGPDQIGLDATYNYAVATIGKSLNDREVNPRDFPWLAKFDTTTGSDGTDDTAAINACLSFLANNGGGRCVFPHGKKAKILGTLLVATGVKVDGNACFLYGSGTGGNNIIESAYVNAGVLTTNVGTAPESHRVTDAQVRNLRILNCGRAFNLYDFCEQSSLADIWFQDCTYAVYTDRPFYSAYRRLISRGTAGGATNAAFNFVNFVNAIEVDSVRAINRVLGFNFDGGCYGLTISGRCTAEQGTNGMRFQGTVKGLHIRGHYFESLTGNALEFSGGGSAFLGVDIDNGWFNIIGGACISAINFTGRYGPGNVREVGTYPVDFSASSNTAVVEAPGTFGSTNITAPGLPTGYMIGPRCKFISHDTLVDGSGVAAVRGRNAGGNLAELNYYGDPGDPGAGIAAFCVVTSGATTTIDTKIVARKTSVMYFNYIMIDGVSTYQVYGRIYGLNAGTFDVKQDDTSGKTVTASAVGGFLRLSVATMSGATTARGRVTF